MTASPPANIRKPQRLVTTLRRWAPVVVAGAALSIGLWGFLAISSEFPSAGPAQKIFAALAMFTGGYIPLDASTPVPPTSIALPSMAAFGLTFTTAIWIIISLTTKRLRVALRIRRTNPQLVVVGSEATASAIMHSALRERIPTVLIAESEDSQAARTAEGGALVVTVASVESCIETPSIRRLLERARNVVIATDSAPVNLTLRDQVAPIRKGRDENETDQHGALDDFRSLIAVVHDPVLAETMRPAKLTDITEVDVTCPDENIAEHICHLVDAAATHPAVFAPGNSISPAVDAITVQVVDVEAGPNEVQSWPLLAPTIERWLRRLSWSRVFLNGSKQPDGLFTPIIPITVIPSDAPPSTLGLNIRIYAGGPQAVIARAVEDRAAQELSPTELIILVTERAMARTAHHGLDVLSSEDVLTGHEWLNAENRVPAPDSGRSEVIIVDPLSVGLDARLVVDDVNLQLARMFAQTYEFMFATNRTIKAWEPGAPLGNAVAAEEERAEQEVRSTPPGEASPGDLEARITAARTSARKSISNRYSNRYAVMHMIEQLQTNYTITRLPLTHERCPVAPLFPSQSVSAMAAAEHKHWQSGRKWRDRSPRPRTAWQRIRRQTPDPIYHNCSDDSSSGADLFTFNELKSPLALTDLLAPQTSDAQKFAEKINTVHQRCARRDATYKRNDAELLKALKNTAEYNERIITETYPALAARFGYAIVRADQRPFPLIRSDNEDDWPLYSRIGKVRAAMLDETYTWTTESGDQLTGQRGDWLIQDVGGRRWICDGHFFATGRFYEKFDGDIYTRIGTVRARPAEAGEVVDTLAGLVVAPDHGWVLHGPSNDRWPVSDRHFARFYAAQ